MSVEGRHEFSTRRPSREDFLSAAFDRQPDVVTASAVTGVDMTVPKETLGQELVAVYVPKGAPDAEKLVVLVYDGELSVTCLELGDEGDARRVLDDQYDAEYEGLVFQTDVKGHPAVAWTAVDVPLEHDERGLMVEGTGIVLTASQVMWVDGTKVCWVTHPDLPHEELLQVALSMV